MYTTKLGPLLIKGTFAPGSVVGIAVLCDDWFRDEASLVSFTFRSIFRGLIARGWDDPQAVPTPEFDRFVDDVLPRLNAVLAVLPGDPTAALHDLALAYHSSI
jgi:hypothetical protein